MSDESIIERIEAMNEQILAIVDWQQKLRNRFDDIVTEIDAINIRIEALLNERRRKSVATVEVREANVCGLHPEIDSTVCPSANVYRFQQGCLGTSCVEKNRQYYADRRAKKRAEQA